jgi:Ran GTPase-activating protein (RanGAP) involved in mRNA processing and transport
MLSPCLIRAQGITKLDLGGNTFGLAACEHVAKTLSSVPTLKELLFDDMFTSRKESEIHPALKLFTLYIPVQHLVYLDLRCALASLVPVVATVSVKTNHVR